MGWCLICRKGGRAPPGEGVESSAPSQGGTQAPQNVEYLKRTTDWISSLHQVNGMEKNNVVNEDFV